jgi:putative addiction module component (TIGR02574 family)
MTVAAALKEIEGFSRDEQLQVVHALWDRLVESGWQPSVTDSLQRELDRRIEDADNQPDDVLTWEQIEAHVRRKR